MPCILFGLLAAATPTGFGQQPVTDTTDNAGADNTVPLAPTLDMGGAVSTNAELPRVRLTPPVVAVDGLDPFRLDLSGAWNFAHRKPVKFTGKVKEVPEWGVIKLPGHFALQGYNRLENELGRAVIYSKTVDIPAGWANHSVALRFESVDGLVRLWVNETPVGSSDSAFLPVEYDVTPFVKPGEPNTVTLSVEVSELTSWYLRPLGGMGRPASLTALPLVHIARLHVDTDLNDDGSASLNAHVSVRNDAVQAMHDVAVAFELRDRTGKRVALPRNGRADVPTVSPGATWSATIPFDVAEVETWDPEHPRLYTLTATLETEAGSMTAERAIGFREVEIDGHSVLVNGRPLTLFGANYHVTHPGFGHHPPVGLIRKDLKLLRDANFNALRAWPTPYRDYIDATNELGLFTTIEVPVNLQLYAPGIRKDHGNNPALDGPYLSLAARVLETYRSDPSVLFWGLANESIYYPYFQRAARAIHASDPTRPVFFGGDGRMGVDIPGVQLNDEHYPRDGVATLDDLGNITADPLKPNNFGWHFPKDKPAISSEWLHTHVNNRAQITLDPGVDDYWGYVAEAHAEWTRRTPNFVGGFQFLSAPYHEIGGENKWRGLFDDHRRPTPNYWHMKKSSSPVTLDLEASTFDDEAGRIELMIENRQVFSDLNELSWTWTQGELSGELSPLGGPGDLSRVTLPWNPELPPIELRAQSPRGFEVDRFVLSKPTGAYTEQNGQRATPPDAVVDYETTTDGHHLVRAGGVAWLVSNDSGLLLDGRLGERSMLDAGPKLVVRGNGFPGEGRDVPPMGDILRGWTADRVRVDASADAGVTVTATGRYNHAEGTWRYRFRADGSCDVTYDFTWTWETPRPIDAFEVGVGFNVPAPFDTLHWRRDAQWSAYPDDHIGRPVGEAPALGDPQHRAARENGKPNEMPAWPWSQDLQGGVTRDFRSSKLNFVTGGLFDRHGIGLLATANGRQHLRALPRNERDPAAGFLLQVNDFFNGGTEYHLIKSLRIERLQLEAGTKLTGTATIRPTRRSE